MLLNQLQRMQAIIQWPNQNLKQIHAAGMKHGENASKQVRCHNGVLSNAKQVNGNYFQHSSEANP